MFNLNIVQRARARALKEKKKQGEDSSGVDAQSPADGEESQDDEAGSNYSQGVKERAAKDLKALKNGDEVYRTEDEDAEDEEEFIQEISKAQNTYQGKRTIANKSVADDGSEERAVSPSPAKKRARKGKQKASTPAHAPPRRRQFGSRRSRAAG